MAREFDAVLLLSFGGPEGPDDVVPFLRNVLRGRPVPAERIDQVAAHYLRFGGRSPINDLNRQLMAALAAELERRGRALPVFWGNRNWSPYVADAVREMMEAGVRRAAVFTTSAYPSYSSCRQYREDLELAARQAGEGAPELVKLRPYADHPGFTGPLAEGLRAALGEIGPGATVLMSAHSIPLSAATSCRYEEQLRSTAAVVAGLAGVEAGRWQLVFQSRSGPPGQPWLEPDVNDAIRSLPVGTPGVVVCPIGFVSDHMEVVYDLDTEAAATAAARGIPFARSPTPGTHPSFVEMACQLIEEVETGSGPDTGLCGPGCCPPPGRPVVPERHNP